MGSDLMGNEGNGGWRTVECLRGRLLAERVASKAAKAQVEQLSTKLDELEKLIAKEIESRDKAERRLKNALKKLESLKLFDDVSGSSVSSSSECVSLMKHDLGKQEARQSDGEEVSGISSIDSSIQSGSQDGSCSSVGTGHSHNKEESYHDARQQHDSVKEPEAADQTKYEDNSLALVPSNMWINSNAKKPEMRNDAQEVLRALRLVRQQLQNSVDQRRAVVSSPKELYGQ